MTSIPYILATAGHIDHGKSALVRALTGTDPDRLPEEKARGITIELGFAHLRLPAPRDFAGAEEFDVGIVDVPGHEDFVRNMVAGVGSIDAALLVVAADDGWMPQTEEHLQILSYLGVTHGVVALTKSDLATNLPASIAAIREQLRGTPFESSEIVPTSVDTGSGIAPLKEAIARVLARAPLQKDLGKPRLPVDRAFSLKGIGTIVTGTLTGGTIGRGQDVVIQPGGIRAHVRTVHSHGCQIETGRPGSRVALNLPEVAAAAHRTKSAAHAVARGDVVTMAGVGMPTKVIDVLLERSPRAGDHPLRSGSALWLHQGSAAIPARIRLLDRLDVQAGERSLARLVLESPALLLLGDRFVLRDWSEQHTLAGGVVLDVDPPSLRHGGRQREMLAARALAPLDVQAYVVSQLGRDLWAGRASLLARSRFSSTEIATALDEAVRAGRAVAEGPIVADPAAWSALLAAAAEAIDAHHRSHPEHTGLPLPQVKRIVPAHAPAVLFDALLSALGRHGFVRRGGMLAREDHHPALPPRLEAAGRRMRETLKRHPFDPPSRKELAPDDASIQALKFLIAAGDVVDVGPELVLAADAYRAAAQRVRDYIREHGPATVSQLKTALASSRRVMVPLMERLDRDGITLRQGDLRVLRSPAAVPELSTSP